MQAPVDGRDVGVLVFSSAAYLLAFELKDDDAGRIVAA